MNHTILHYVFRVFLQSKEESVYLCNQHRFRIRRHLVSGDLLNRRELSTATYSDERERVLTAQIYALFLRSKKTAKTSSNCVLICGQMREK
jgi:hypothetical protein